MKHNIQELNLKKLRTDMLNLLVQEDEPGWIDECQDRADSISEAAEAVLKAAGYSDEHEDWDGMLEALRAEVSWVPGHFE